MNRAILIIFVDAYPYKKSERLFKLLGLKVRKSLSPGIGYSINVKSELFSGLKPDDLGSFCEWRYDDGRKISTMLLFFSCLFHRLSKLNDFIGRVLHRLVRVFLGKPVYAIPFHILPFLKFSGPVAYEHSYGKPSFLSTYNFRRVLYSEYSGSDIAVFKEAVRVIDSEDCKRLFVSTAELDSVMHRYGMDSTEYENHIDLIDDNIINVVDSFRAKHGDNSEVIVFSDHGMAPVKKSVSFDPEVVLGPPKGKYCYFIDATFLRVWTDDEELRCRLLEALQCFGEGTILTLEQRKEFGILNQAHGDVIYLLDEGKMFSPSFFGKKACRAMHGYNPFLDSQKGMILTNFDIFETENINSIKFYQCIVKLLSGLRYEDK